jgi:hypothetical protein
MGHIVNAKGMRLGIISSWCDEWYSELQFIQNIYIQYIEYDFF